MWSTNPRNKARQQNQDSVPYSLGSLIKWCRDLQEYDFALTDQMGQGDLVPEVIVRQ